MTLRNGRQAVLLDRGWDRITSELHVLQHEGMKGSIFKFADWVDANITLLENIKLLNAFEVNSGTDMVLSTE